MADGLDPRARERVGSVLDEKWTLERLLGAGGMGAVYAARHRNGARAAVKILHPGLARLDEVRERFLREGYAANKVEHRGVVQVLDDDVVSEGPDAGSAYLVMELLEGESLHDRAARPPPLTEIELLEVTDAVLDVLAAAHAHGVVHRDLKPENVFLAEDPEREGVRVKVLDFGLARIAEAASVTSAGMAVGTPSFMSPEQAAGKNAEIDGRTDVFALGATLFKLVTGRRVHVADNMIELVMKMATEPAPPLRTVATDASEALAGVVDRALFFDREDRPTAAGLQEVVRKALTVLRETDAPGGPRLRIIPSSARNVRVAAPAEADMAPAPAAVSSAPRPAPIAARVARSSTLPWALVLVLLVVVGWTALPSIGGALDRHAGVAPPPSAPPAVAPPARLPDPPPSAAPAPSAASPPLPAPPPLETVELPPDPAEELAAPGEPDAGVRVAGPRLGAPSAATPKKPPPPIPPWVRKRQQRH